MNRGQMRLEVRRAIGELTADLWSDSEINDWLNEGAKILISNSQALQAIYQLTTVAAQQEYVLPDFIDEVFNLTLNYNGLRSLTNVRPEQVQLGTFMQGIPGWFYTRYLSQQTGDQTSSGITVDDVDPQGQHSKFVLGLFPCPNSALQLTVSYYARHFEMKTDGAVPQVPPEFRRGIVAYATALAKEKEGAYGEADRKRKEFSDFSDRLREKMICDGQSEFPCVTTDEDEPLYGDVIIKFGTAS